MKKNLNDQEKLELIWESIFSGNVDKKTKDEDDDNEDTDKKKNKKSDSKEKETKEDDDEEEDAGSEDDDNDEDTDEDKESDSENEENDDDDDSDDSDDSESSYKEKSPAKSKLKALQRQYNDLLIDLFDKYAIECIETALEESETSFGENIEVILTSALDALKGKILSELGLCCDEHGQEDIGIESDEDGEGDDEGEAHPMVMPPEAMGSFDPEAAKNIPMEINI